MTQSIFCVKLQTKAPSLEAPPFPGELGQQIFNSISKKAWEQWLNQQTMLINEYRLSLTDPEARKFLFEEMRKFLFNEA
ncbi:MAG: oxidative damage protection protein [Legionellaceae bacterium]|nr:oxidative damage protection protein [Legionellaceae bacterium]HCA88840.1 oxidative damage protection protein [Legionellales bacterium]|tara:strand:+ start:1605 stop:1841 length:237 start_codon:yes stop_codon:yes gene_type:complete